MKWLGIVNPHSGWGKRGAPLSKTLFSLKKTTPDHVLTDYSGHAEELAREASSYDGFAIVGGDGTIFEVLNGMDFKRQALKIIPAGTGNSLARDLGLRNTEKGVGAQHQSEEIVMDLMRVSFTDKDGRDQVRISASTVALGYPATVAKEGNNHYKSFGGLCYPVAAAAVTFFQKRFRARLNYLASSHESRSLSGLVMNNTCHVANFLAFPEASIEDGFFEVMEMCAGALKQNLHNVSILTKTYLYAPVVLKKEKSLFVEPTTPQDLMIDGEIYPDIIRIHVEILPRQLRCHQDRMDAI